MSCSACGADLEPDAGRCKQCGKVVGEVNRCPQCSAVAGLSEIAPDHYVCVACGAKRPAKVGTVVLRSYAEALERGAKRRFWTAWLVITSGVVLALAALATGALLWGPLEMASAGQITIALGAALLGLHLWAGQRLRRQVTEMKNAALERRLVQEVRSHGAGLTPELAAAALSQDLDEIDQLLTELAKRGRLQLDVLDDGNLRYRVPRGSLAPPPPPGVMDDEDELSHEGSG